LVLERLQLNGAAGDLRVGTVINEIEREFSNKRAAARVSDFAAATAV
jgi:hypothetical protein